MNNLRVSQPTSLPACFVLDTYTCLLLSNIYINTPTTYQLPPTSNLFQQNLKRKPIEFSFGRSKHGEIDALTHPNSRHHQKEKP